MASKEQKRFLKNIGDYFQVDINEHDEKMVIGYLDDYVKTIKLTPITIVKKEYVYVKTEQSTDDDKPLNHEDILEIVAKLTEVPKIKMIAKTRLGHIVLARQMACYLMRVYCHLTLDEIGEIMNRDHTTIMWSERKVKNYIKCEDEMYCKLLTEATEMINNIKNKNHD